MPGINEPHYLSKAKAFTDSDWCNGDLFLESANAHYVFFALTGPLTTVLSLPAVAVIGRLGSFLLMAIGWTSLSRRLGLRAVAIPIAAAAWCGISLTGNLSGEWVIGGYEGKVPSYAFALLGVSVWISAWQRRSWQRYALSGCCFGASISLHPVVGAWFCVAIAVAETILHLWPRGTSPTPDHPRTTSVAADPSSVAQADEVLLIPRRPHVSFLKDGLVFVIASTIVALPGLIPAATMILNSELPQDDVDRANYIQVFWRLKHHLDPTEFPVAAWIHSAALLLTSLLTVCAVTRFDTRPAQDPAEPVSVEHADNSPLRIAQSWRLWWALLLVALLIAAAGVAIGWHSGPILKTEGWQWRASLLKFYPFRLFDAMLPMTFGLSAALLTRLIPPPRRHSISLCVLLLIIVSTLFGAFQQRREAPPGYSPTAFVAWKDAGRWIQNNLPPDALVYGPRESFGFYWHMHRAQYVCFKDCPQDTPGILEWNSRLWDMHHWSERAYADQNFDVAETEELYRKFGITHLITRQLGPFEAEPIYRNDVWRIYDVRPAIFAADP
ncbi:MAG: hypothetical protein Fues2KO_30450 [Fuerstiella sp.]